MPVGGIAMNNFKQYYKHSIRKRQDILKESFKLDADDFNNLDIEVADNMIENVIGMYELPLGLATNFVINGKDYVIPLATEEPSVIAAASNGAKTIALSGGFTATVNERTMIGQIAFSNPSDIETYNQYLKANFETLQKIAQEAHPSIYKRGGGLVSIDTKSYAEPGKTPFYCVYFNIDTKEAMGANIVNTILEAIKPVLEVAFQLDSLMSIISNYSLNSTVTINCTIDPNLSQISLDHCYKIQEASDLASLDPYRTTTHNKGIMNGITAAVLASGNDTRAIEAGAHAFATTTGRYQPLATWQVENGKLLGSLTIPMAIGSFGTNISLHPKAQLGQKILQTTDAKELMMILASVGLAQNFAALKALTSVGIQKGHMGLHARSLLTSAGASDEEMPHALELLKQSSAMNTETAVKILNQLRKTSKKSA